jgi:hypothetical protein
VSTLFLLALVWFILQIKLMTYEIRNEIDPVSPLGSAVAALNRLGNNARVIEQKGGVGHTTSSQTSFCTHIAIRAYFLDGKIPKEAHTLCEVDQKPWQPWGGNLFPNGQ